jgi:RNA polymerase sigma-70 factor (ECF subfamily)
LSRLPRFEFDGEYIRRLIAGDPETEQHFTRYFGDLLTLKLRSRLRSAALVEDARQETFVRVLRTLKQKGGVASPEGFGSFVNSVCNNVLFELYRADSRTTPLEQNEDWPEERRASAEGSLIESDERSRVHQVLADLPEKEKQLLRWLFFEERDKDDVCRQLNIDRNYLRVLVHRAKARFRERFAEAEERV